MNIYRLAPLALAISAVVAAPAMAHPKLLSSTPAVGATVAPLKQISMTFSEGLVAAVSGAELIMDMPGAAPMKMSSMKTSIDKDGKTFLATLPKALPAGTYTLNWHVVSTDTHRVEGKLPFTIK
jgi:methionine-rich copper-binding protein CopC